MCCVKSNCSGQKPEREAHESCVTEIQEAWRELRYLKLREEVENGIGEHVDGRSARNDEAPPPPTMILRSSNISSSL